MYIPISIIMPVYNVEDYLDRSIQSIQQQSLSDWELIIVNDGSTDGSPAICNNYQEIDSRIKVIHQENAGAGRARQTALNEALGEYICFVDPDDYLIPTALEENYKIANKYDLDVIINGFVELVKESDGAIKEVTHKPDLKGYMDQKDFRKDFLKTDMFFARALWNKLYNHNFLKRNNCKFSDQRVGQDALFNYDVYHYVSSAFINEQAYYRYDTSREGSAVKGYKPNRGEYEKNIADSFVKLIDEWDRIDSYKEFIQYEYWMVIFTELKNLSFKDCPLKTNEKISVLKQLRVNESIDEALNNINFKKVNSFRRVLLILLKNNQYRLAIYIMKMRLFIL